MVNLVVKTPLNCFLLSFVLTVVAVLLASKAVDAAYSIGSDDEIRASARTIAYDLMSYYSGNQSGQVPGILPGPPPKGDYYWWEGGALMGAMIDYWHLTGDATYNDVVSQGMLHQVGDNRDYQPVNYTASLGNDDQAFWGMSAMLAAEVNFPNPPPDQPQWLSLAQAVFNTQAAPARHDKTCGGGMRWQIPIANAGYNYKNSIANGCFFNMGARLARYTGNSSYADWAETQWDWLQSVGFIDADYNIYDGETNCTDINRALFSYTYGVMVLGAANMYNFTNGSAKWEARVKGLLTATFETFFLDDVITEVACEPHDSCTTDMLSFKGYVHRWLTTATTVAPFTRAQVLPILRKSAEAAVATCTGGKDGRQCGFKWSTREFDGKTGAGQQMNVLGAVTSLLQKASQSAPLTNSTGGTSTGDPDAGTGPQIDVGGRFRAITDGDRAGASFLTIASAILFWVFFFWLLSGMGEEDANPDGAEEVRERRKKAKGVGLLRRLKGGYRGVYTGDDGGGDVDSKDENEKRGAARLPLARGRLKRRAGDDRPKVKVPLLHNFWQPGSKE
ncbi:hypothetical protein MCOR29_000552 [Pyricularia oryzae]|uniref:mannan endo-1,6-alpha-mannosidase n=1 Tax=Pyricularia grisea TaxID=148305 RepID=A0ABQ8NGT1_PYRGI|nr:hypothetical protein MCOR33_006642 [Pyricularia grisea]KAI6334803.1 hypothetical protein MCOR29_000552 [Pyricularia oryzae]KAI6376417.1 hypothetical protein MCOR31_001685 [Pyricularia oryzae]KAI6414760.1 hypothetical protein MCOR20_001943 [Pyricularia oryzae]KAI6436313.1 hypothetical protein MCOR21_001228 [Pyricularia oryzae]